MGKIYYPHEGQFVLLDTLFDDQSFLDVYLCLYQNDYTPTVDSTVGNFTACVYTGYASKQLNRGSWTLTQGSGDSRSYASYAQQIFTYSSNPSPTQYAYGYYIAIGAGLTWYILAAERFATRQQISTNTTIAITPKITLGDYT
jgi:hypothetical protein